MKKQKSWEVILLVFISVFLFGCGTKEVKEVNSPHNTGVGTLKINYKYFRKGSPSLYTKYKRATITVSIQDVKKCPRWGISRGFKKECRKTITTSMGNRSNSKTVKLKAGMYYIFARYPTTVGRSFCEENATIKIIPGKTKTVTFSEDFHGYFNFGRKGGCSVKVN